MNNKIKPDILVFQLRKCLCQGGSCRKIKFNKPDPGIVKVFPGTCFPDTSKNRIITFQSFLNKETPDESAGASDKDIGHIRKKSAV